MEVEIFPVRLGVDQAYILKGRGTVMIDGGAPGKLKCFLREMDRIQVPPDEIKLIILTHGHWDHIGSASDIQMISGAKIAMHEEERSWLEKPVNAMPPGACLWGRVFGGILKLFLRWIRITPARVAVSLGNGDYSLHEYGIPGRIIHTPGHSPGSVSILLDSGDAFVGDLAMNAFPMRLTPGVPIFADDIELVKLNWKKLLDLGAKRIYPAHGQPFSSEVFLRAVT